MQEDITHAMESPEKVLFNKEFLGKWYSNYYRLENLTRQNKFVTDDLDTDLAQWVDIQRRIRHMLPGELKIKLATVGFNFKEESHSWETMHRQLVEFVEENGYACLPADQEHAVLHDWLTRQIINKRFLTESQFQELDSLGVDWGMFISRDFQWEQMFSRLNNFYNVYGHCRVPQKWAEDRKLALWVTRQRLMYRKNKLREDRQRRLTQLGFVWSIKVEYDSQWEHFFQELASFRQAYGTCRVPSKNQKLVSWIERQRLSKKKNLLSIERARRLEEIDFIWNCEDIKKEGWNERYRQLCAYRKRHGHSLVPVNFEENRALGVWVATQRSLEAKGMLIPVRKKKLDQVGFVWSRDTQDQLKCLYDAQWESKLEKLGAYKKKHGSCQVSVKIDPALQRWTSWQRAAFYQGNLTSERIGRLNELRFPWSVQEGYWMRMYEALMEFKRQFGHTRVPCQWEPNPRLAAWAYRMRRDKQELTAQKLELLNGIGFDWALTRKTVVPWREMYDRLVEYRQKHGHSRVPVKWHEDLKLGKWASRMRHEKESLDPERVALLEAIGFDWIATIHCNDKPAA